MFRFALCSDLIDLKCKYPQLRLDGLHGWGLKQMGYLFAYDHLRGHEGEKILEVGAGLSLIFDKHIGKQFDYTMLDQPGFYDERKFELAMEARRHTAFIPGLLGETNSLLPEESFDVIFSISVLEHIPQDRIKTVCDDMFRILKPGGKIVHTIDIWGLENANSVGWGFYNSLVHSGFDLPGKPTIKWRWKTGEPILLEPLEIVYTYYLNMKDDMWTRPCKVNHHAATILTVARKKNTRALTREEKSIHIKLKGI